ncbi:hypothetical protein NDN08_005444 [Rhodosorus marinus]|uniref:Uncharacterized protein n=1 Tax=Rhodosorus marinus TaxID=101924 RepID=A0AAV8V3A1_9RHOD|nr:hypothetical protein NDN08_005444 [Rhodosorus marinus]
MISRVVFVICLISLLRSTFGKTNTVRFVIVPGGEGGEAIIPLDTPPIPDSTCVFKFDVYGATTESWFGKISANPETQEIECTIYRAGDQETYLLFNSYEVAVGTADVSEVINAHVKDGEGDPVESKNFVMEKNKLLPAPGWKGSAREFQALAKYFI